ncbi:MAG: hypothetical protein IKR52_03515, partial [Paludibacteraceae bacterium]|nr:hypothetical protein [Paludibacteraceae bacterium]
AYFGVGAVAGAIGSGVATGAMCASAGASFGAGFVGSNAGVSTILSVGYTSSFVSGAIAGGLGGLSSGFVTGFGNNIVQGGSFGSAMRQGLLYGAIGGAGGALLGGISGGIAAVRHNCSFWNGKENVLIDELDYGFEYNPQAPGSNDCFVKCAEKVEYRYGKGRSSYELRQAIGKTNDELITISDMQKAGYDISKFDMSNLESRVGTFRYMQRTKSPSFYGIANNDGSGHMTLVNKMQMWQRHSGKIYFRLFTMDPLKGPYVPTRITNNFFIVKSIH